MVVWEGPGVEAWEVSDDINHQQVIEDALRAWIAQEQDGAIVTDYVVAVAAVAPSDSSNETRYSQLHSDSAWHTAAGLTRFLSLSLEDDLMKVWRDQE